ncbi:MAG TPA: hypothetical protein PKK33_09985, partial [Candidatus Cloacimonadota bacterium]|nr:hypothetical protein [Candidatus Cloacimonadota bacterium]
MKWVVCLLLLFCFESLHTITITIGSGQLNNVPLPVDAYFNFSYSQVIYLQSEIQHAGVINRISYPYHIVSSDFLSNVNHLKVYMGLTSRTVFQSNTDWVSLDSLQLVFDGDWSTSDFSTTLPGDGWVTLPLTSYFNYDNTHNLVIAVDENQTGHVSMSDKFLCSPVTGARGLDCHSDIADIDPITPPPAALSNPRANIANIRINMITDFSEPMNPYPADGMTGVELVPHFSWSCNAESYALYMGLSTDQLVLKTDSLTTNTWTAAEILQPNTTYYWQVKAHYGPQIVNSGIWHFTSGA